MMSQLSGPGVKQASAACFIVGWKRANIGEFHEFHMSRNPAPLWIHDDS